ncbi:MAG: NHL repeat-containing protein [Caldilineaceae bacterium]
MPWGIAVDELGDVYVADWRNDRVQKFSATGEFCMTIGQAGCGNGEFNRPSGVAVDLHGDIYVADRGNNRVQLFSAEGAMCRSSWATPPSPKWPPTT